MNTFIFYILFIIFVAILLLSINFLLSSHNPYMEKKTAFECGFHSFLGQNRTQFTISFFIFAISFLLLLYKNRKQRTKIKKERNKE